MKFSPIFLLLTVYSCNILSLGYYNLNNQYVPKIANYKLKNKKGFVFPKKLDTMNIYQLKYDVSLIDGKKYYPKNENGSYNPDIHNADHYIKFFSKRRCLLFSKRKDPFGFVDSLKISDIAINKGSYVIGYYFSDLRGNILIETFGKGDGLGKYFIEHLKLNEQGDTLISTNKRSEKVYTKYKIAP